MNKRTLVMAVAVAFGMVGCATGDDPRPPGAWEGFTESGTDGPPDVTATGPETGSTGPVADDTAGPSSSGGGSMGEAGGTVTSGPTGTTGGDTSSSGEGHDGTGGGELCESPMPDSYEACGCGVPSMAACLKDRDCAAIAACALACESTTFGCWQEWTAANGNTTGSNTYVNVVMIDLDNSKCSCE